MKHPVCNITSSLFSSQRITRFIYFMLTIHLITYSTNVTILQLRYLKLNGLCQISFRLNYLYPKNKKRQIMFHSSLGTKPPFLVQQRRHLGSVRLQQIWCIASPPTLQNMGCGTLPLLTTQIKGSPLWKSISALCKKNHQLVQILFRNTSSINCAMHMFF